MNLDRRVGKQTFFVNSILPNVFLWLIYAATVCFTAAHHEPWCDEADSWLYARDENGSYILSRTGYMGTPALWYFVLMPLAKSGLPYCAMTGVNVLFALVTAALIIFRSPFNFWLRALICFSYLFVYEYSVIARSYGIAVLLIMSLAVLQQNRQKHSVVCSVLIGLLANTNVHGLIVALAMTGSFVMTNWKKGMKALAPMLIACAGILASILQLLPPKDGQFPSSLHFDKNQPILSTFKGAFFPDPSSSIDHMFSEPMFTGPVALVLKVLAFVIIFLIAKKLWSNRFAFLTFVASYTGLFTLFAFKYLGSVRHWGFFVLVAIYCLWIEANDAKSAQNANASATPISNLNSKFDVALQALLLLSFGYSAAVGLYACVTDIKRPFSSCQEISAELNRLNPAKDPVVSNPNCGLSILPYNPELRLFYPNLNDFGTHAMWNHAEKQVLTTDQVCEIVDQRIGAHRKVFLLTDKESPELVQHGYKLLYRNAETPITTSENLLIYLRE